MGKKDFLYTLDTGTQHNGNSEQRGGGSSKLRDTRATQKRELRIATCGNNLMV